MIYIKIKNKVYSENQLKEGIKDFPLAHIKAYYRIVYNTLKKDLKLYPDIDIIINYKNIHNILGRFSKNQLIQHKEYKFIKQGKPYIVLFIHAIENYYTFNHIRGLIQVIYHEFIHYKQCLNKEKLKHNKHLKACSNKENLNNEILQHKKILNIGIN